ncbi:MAG TPA: O-methyltransferase [Sphingobacteriaceae bacterium]|nr:O-methyltransferase [Sphingobacteriaceae bacterium]
MDITESILNAYLEQNCDPESTLLAQINRETHLTQTQSHMLSGHYQGRILALFSKLISPSRILEIGTFTGYSALCLLEGLHEKGELHTIDKNEELEERVRGYFEASGKAQQIHFHIGNALDIIPGLPHDFDLVFIDADKKNNLSYLELAYEKTRTGALIMIDNVLWKGRVFDEHPDTQTRYILELNEALAEDKRFDKLILPVRDGVYLLRKR